MNVPDSTLRPWLQNTFRRVICCTVMVLLTVGTWLWCLGTPIALAGINDDKFDGNIFALYGGNGSLVPAKVGLADSLKAKKPALLVYFLDDSRDCKQFAIVVNRLQGFYGRAANIIPVNVDTLPLEASSDPTNPRYYYQGLVPQTVLIDQNGKAVFNESGQVAFEKVDDSFREVFNLLPRSESVELKVRTFNEFNTELSQ